MKATDYMEFSQRIWTVHATLEITDALSALPQGTNQITVTVLAFNKNGDEANVFRFKT